MHTNLGHLRITHLQEPFASLVVAQQQFEQHHSCDAICARVKPSWTTFACTTGEFGDTAAIGVFVLSDNAGNQLILDLASTFGVVAIFPASIRRSCGIIAQTLDLLLSACHDG